MLAKLETDGRDDKTFAPSVLLDQRDAEWNDDRFQNNLVLFDESGRLARQFFPHRQLMHCPICDSELPAEAVLCVQCGYHLIRKQRVATETSATRRASALDANPYASTADMSPDVERRLLPLDEETARRADTIADGAFKISTTLIMVFLFTCPFWLFAFPFSVVRFCQWLYMRRKFQELRYPNALSPYADIAVRFEEAGLRYLFAIFAQLLLIGGIAALIYRNTQ